MKLFFQNESKKILDKNQERYWPTTLKETLKNGLQSGEIDHMWKHKNEGLNKKNDKFKTTKHYSYVVCDLKCT